MFQPDTERSLKGSCDISSLWPRSEHLVRVAGTHCPGESMRKLIICARIKTRDDDFNRADAVRHPNYQKHVSSDTTLERRYPHQWYILISNGNLEHVCCCTDWSGMP